MKKPKLVLLHGMIATGKTTALYNLRERKEMKDWIIIDFCELKKQFAHLGDEKRKEYGKKALAAILKLLMKEKKNIVLDEMPEKSIRKYVGPQIRKYKYEVVPFQFTSKIELSIKREAERRIARGLKPHGEKWVRDFNEHHKKVFDKNAILIDTTKLNKKQVVDFIIKRVR